jgi:hypothetical protein
MASQVVEHFLPDGLLANYKRQWQFRYSQGFFEAIRAYSMASEGNRFWFPATKYL